MIGYTVEDGDGQLLDICGPYEHDEKCRYHVDIQRLANPTLTYTIIDISGASDEPGTWLP